MRRCWNERTETAERRNERGQVIRGFGSSTASYDDLAVGQTVMVLASPVLDDGAEPPAKYVGIVLDDQQGQ